MSKITALYERAGLDDMEHIRRQKNNLTTYAENNDFHNLCHYTDCPSSNLPLEERTQHHALEKLMADVKAGKIATVIVTDLTRLGHNYMALTDLVNELDRHGVRFIAIANAIDSLPEHIHDEDNGLDYTLHGDYYYPDLIEQDPEDERTINKWGRMCQHYLQEHRPGFYARLMLSGQLPKYLADISEAADRREEAILKSMKSRYGITEQLKAENQMEWIARMGLAEAVCREVIQQELIFD